MIELYKKLQPGYLTGDLRPIASVEMQEIADAVEPCDNVQAEEFLDWFKTLPRSKTAVQEDKDAEEVRKRLEWEHKQNQLPGQFPNDKYAG